MRTRAVNSRGLPLHNPSVGGVDQLAGIGHSISPTRLRGSKQSPVATIYLCMLC